MTTDHRFPSATLLDPLGTRIVLTEDTKQNECLNIRIQPRHGGDPEVVLNRTTAVLLQRTLELWLEHVDSNISAMFEEEQEEGFE